MCVFFFFFWHCLIQKGIVLLIVQQQIACSASWFLIQNNSAFIRFVLSLILLQSFLHFININSPDSLFCLVVFLYHRHFCFPFVSHPREMSSSAIKSESFSKEALQPRDVGAIFLLRVVVVLFSVFLPLHFLMPESGSDFTYFLGGDVNALKTCSLTFFSCLPWADILGLSFVFVPTSRYQTVLPHAIQTQKTVPRQPVVLLGFFSWDLLNYSSSFTLSFTFSAVFLVVFNADE